jgi:hypothetical protein
MASCTKPLAAALALVACACAPPPKRQPYNVDVHFLSDPGVPLAGATLQRGGNSLGQSGDDGLLALALEGQPGDTIELQPECPSGYRTPTAPLAVLLRELASRPEYTIACPPLTRTLVIAVRAQQGPHLPLRHLGTELARTDAAGVAHAVLQAKPGDTLTLTLDTSAQPELMPQQPELRVHVPERDELFVFDQAFHRPKPKAVPRKPPEPSGPQRI